MQLTQDTAVDALIYASYKANRLASPEIAPVRWEAIYGDITKLEDRFQARNEKLNTKS